MSELVIYKRKGNVGIVTLNRPESNNTFNSDMLKCFLEALNRANNETACKVILLNANGDNFSLGDDLIAATSVMPDVDEQRDFMNLLQNVSRALMFNRKPVVGAFQGWVVGGALSWSLNCDFPIWGSKVKGYLPETKYGIFASGGTSFLLPHRVGHLQAMEIFFSGEKYTAESMKEKGLVLRVVEEESLQGEALNLAENIAKYSSESLGDYKEAIVNSYRDRLDKAMHNEAFHCVIASQSPAVKHSLEKFVDSLSDKKGRAP